MSKPCEYVVSGALTKCTKGSETSLMKANPFRIRFRGLDACTTCDKTPVINIGPFGTCKVSGEDCITKIEITEFEDYKQGVRSGGCNFLLVKSKGICSEGGKISFITSGQDLSLERFLELMQKLEEAYPDWSRKDILSGLLNIAGYGDGLFPALIGVDSSKSLTPRGNLTQNDIDELRNMLKHNYDKGIERGVVTDRTGRKVALGHTLVGIMAALNRNKNKNMDTILGINIPIVGESVDNLYAATLAGDLGKWVARVNHGEDIPPIGTQGSGVSEAELTGDIDALIIGEVLSDEGNRNAAWGSEQPLSALLNNYYTRYDGTRFQNAVEWLQKLYGEDYIRGQINRFAVMYTYEHYKSTVKGRAAGVLLGFPAGLLGTVGGWLAGERIQGIKNELFNDTKNNSDEAFEAYQNFIEAEFEKEKNRDGSESPNGIVTDGSC